MSDVPDLVSVVIGRNEGARLVRCLASLREHCNRIVYVDSGSTDGSCAAAIGFGAQVVDLDMSLPFTAARARNAGWHLALQLWPHAQQIQFVDGDCECIAGWLFAGTDYLAGQPLAAIVFGTVSERFPEQTVYNQLCDWEWRSDAGKVNYCGGNAMVRADILKVTGGFLDNLIAGEEPEFCVRIRAHGLEIHHVAVPMVIHDAAMSTFHQWARRTVRSGHAYAQGWFLHGKAPIFHWRRELVRSVIWGICVPGVIALGVLLAIVLDSLLPALLVMIYPTQLLRLFVGAKGTLRERLIKAWFQLIGKPFEGYGAMLFLKSAVTSRTTQLIEYKAIR